MTVDEELRLSYYKQISTLNASHQVTLVQHIETNRLYVKKVLTVFNASVYDYLRNNPVANTPRIHEAILDGEQLIVIEDYINGTTLEQLVKQSGPLERRRAVEILKQLCVIVNGLHSANPPIIHRDIKPSNIIISQDGVVKLLDMNAAKRFNQFASEDTNFIGTVGYAAPEQYGFGPSSVQTDVYALGVVLNFVLTGKLPRELPAQGRLGAIVSKCTELDPQNRYADAYALYQALDAEAKRLPARDRASESPAPAVRPGKPKRYIQWLPPGFRSLHPLKILGAALLYLLLIAAGLTLEVRNAPSGLEWIDKAFFLLFFFTAVFFLGNYLNVWRLFRLDRVKNPILKLLLVLIVLALLLGIVLTIMTIVENAAGYVFPSS